MIWKVAIGIVLAWLIIQSLKALGRFVVWLFSSKWTGTTLDGTGAKETPEKAGRDG